MNTYCFSGDPPGMAARYHYGGGGVGVLGSLIPATGPDGPGYLYPCLSLPADNDKEIAGQVVTQDFPAGMLTVYEDGGFIVDPACPQGSYSFTVALRQDGVFLGNFLVVVTIGDQSEKFVSFSPITIEVVKLSAINLED